VKGQNLVQVLLSVGLVSPPPSQNLGRGQESWMSYGRSGRFGSSASQRKAFSTKVPRLVVVRYACTAATFQRFGGSKK